MLAPGCSSTLRSCRLRPKLGCCYWLPGAMAPPLCPCGTQLTELVGYQLRRTWAAHEAERWFWLLPCQAYWRYCMPCHLALWPTDRRCCNGNSRPGTSAAPRVLKDGGFMLVNGATLWQMWMPERRSQRVHRSAQPYGRVRGEALTQPPAAIPFV